MFWFGWALMAVLILSSTKVFYLLLFKDETAEERIGSIIALTINSIGAWWVLAVMQGKFT